MIHYLDNQYLKLAVKRNGAEIYSIKSVKTGREFIWDANPKIWANHAPVLFPIVGALKDGIYFYEGKQYSLPQHGFMRANQQVILAEKAENFMKFLLKSNEETKAVYPFDFEFFTTYSLVESAVVVNHEVYNPSNKPLYFSLGAHPAFKCPINKGEEYNDYYLEFEQAENSKTWEIDGGLIGKGTKDVFIYPRELNLHRDIFNEGALVFKDLKSRNISLKCRKSKQVVSVSFEGFPYLGIWAKPQAEFVCIEPWIGIADSVDAKQEFTTKEGIVRLEPKQWFKATYRIDIYEQE